MRATPTGEMGFSSGMPQSEAVPHVVPICGALLTGFLPEDKGPYALTPNTVELIPTLAPRRCGWDTPRLISSSNTRSMSLHPTPCTLHPTPCTYNPHPRARNLSFYAQSSLSHAQLYPAPSNRNPTTPGGWHRVDEKAAIVARMHAIAMFDRF